MSTDNLGRRTCDRCSRPMVKAQRIHQGKEYCSTCYGRVFLRAQCPKCGESVRYHESEPRVPQCGRCERSNRVCIRCGMPAPRARIIIIEALNPATGISTPKSVPVHDACRLQFLEEEPCQVCKRPSRYLQSARHLGKGIKACPTCANSDTHATCTTCRKHRKVESLDLKGRPLCQACSGEQPITHSCPGCGNKVSGSGNSRCELCVIETRMTREVDLWAAIMEREWVGKLYRDFGHWSFARGVPTPALPKKLVQAAAFFRQIDNDEHIKQPIIAGDLLRIFNSKQLRANLNATRFLCERYGFEIDEKARKEAGHEALISKRLQDSSGLPWGPYLKDYTQWLVGKPLRTVSQYLATAQAFCEMCRLDRAFDQAALVQFLEKAPGARATISVWVTFVRNQYGWEVTMPPKSPAKPALRRDAVRLSAVLQRVGDFCSASDSELARAICLLFQFRPRELSKQIKGVTAAGELLTPDGPVVVPNEVKGLVDEWARRNQLTPSN